MAFVNEYISEADKARIDFSKIKHPVHQKPIIPNQWTIDHDRDIALIPLGTFGEPQTRSSGVEERTYIFMMYWQGQSVDVLLYSSYVGNFTTKDLEVTWRIDQIGVPDNVPREEMLKMLKEALFVFGYETIRLRDKVKSVNFAF